jgi:hypothetical protein
MSADGDFTREAEGTAKALFTITRDGINLANEEVVTAFELALKKVQYARKFRDSVIYGDSCQCEQEACTTCDDDTAYLTAEEWEDWNVAGVQLTSLMVRAQSMAAESDPYSKYGNYDPDGD